MAAGLLADLAAQGIIVRRDGDKLRVKGPSGVLTDATLARLRAAKPQILAALADPAPAASSAADWRKHFAARLALAKVDGGRSEAEARAMAWESCITRWMDLHPVTSPAGRCAYCGEAEARGAVVVPFGIEPHAWLHPDCWPAWFTQRRAEAEAALAPVLGDAPPAGRMGDLPPGPAKRAVRPSWRAGFGGEGVDHA